MGRHREFDVEQALDSALRVFWRKGYEAASYGDLTKATGVERPALYSAFGNKEALFRMALDRYYEHYLHYMTDALELPTARDVATHILYSAVALNTRFSDHTGCLGIHGVLAGSDAAEPVRQALIDARANGEERLRDRFRRARAEGDLPAETDPDILAAYILTVLHGMAVQAKAGVDRKKLEAIVEHTLSKWPTSKPAPKRKRR